MTPSAGIEHERHSSSNKKQYCLNIDHREHRITEHRLKDVVNVSTQI